MKEDWKPGTMIYPLPAVLVSCGSTPEEFFYHDINAYKQDKQALEFFKTLSSNQKKCDYEFVYKMIEVSQ